MDGSDERSRLVNRGSKRTQHQSSGASKCQLEAFVELKLLKLLMISYPTSSQAPSYARRPPTETITHPSKHLLTGVKCRATSVAKNLRLAYPVSTYKKENSTPVKYRLKVSARSFQNRNFKSWALD